MDEKILGVSPVRSDQLLDFALYALRENGALPTLSEKEVNREADALKKKILPDHYLPDLYLDLPLTDSPFRGMAAVLDCYDRCLLEYRSDGVFFQSVGLPPLNTPKNRDDLLVVRSSESGTKCDTIDRKLPQTAQLPEAKDVREEFPGIPDLEALRDLPLQYRKETLEDGYRLILTTGIASARKRFVKKPYKDSILRFLSKTGCKETAAAAANAVVTAAVVEKPIKEAFVADRSEAETEPMGARSLFFSE